MNLRLGPPCRPSLPPPKYMYSAGPDTDMSIVYIESRRGFNFVKLCSRTFVNILFHLNLHRKRQLVRVFARFQNMGKQ